MFKCATLSRALSEANGSLLYIFSWIAMPFLTEAQRRPISSSYVRMSNQSRSPVRTPSHHITPQHTSARTPADDVRPVPSIENDVPSGRSRAPSTHIHSAWERQITRWIASRGFADELGTIDSDGAAAVDLPARLRDGVLLGRLLEGLEPGLRLTGFNRKARSRAAAIANLELVLAAVWRRAPLARDMPSAEEVKPNKPA